MSTHIQSTIQRRNLKITSLLEIEYHLTLVVDVARFIFVMNLFAKNVASVFNTKSNYKYDKSECKKGKKAFPKALGVPFSRLVDMRMNL